jgi:hypothetical protein
MKNIESHKTTHIKYENIEADIDTEIAPLIKELWKADMPTLASCECNIDDKVWIQFDNPYTAAYFLSIVLCSRSFKKEIFCENHTDSWHYCCHPYYIKKEAHGIKGEVIEFATCVYFPRVHLERVFTQVKLNNLKDKVE